jgi:hypothetical protein
MTVKELKHYTNIADNICMELVGYNFNDFPPLINLSKKLKECSVCTDLDKFVKDLAKNKCIQYNIAEADGIYPKD